MNDKIKELRKQIDEIDIEIAKLLNKRFDVAREIGYEKSCLKLNVTDKAREEIVKNNFLSEVDDGFKDNASDVLSAIIKASKDLQNK